MIKISPQLYNVFIAVFLFTNCVFSQDKITVLDGALWIKSSYELVELNSNTALKERELMKYFNFNPSIDFAKDKILKRYKNIVSKSASLFIVFKSASKEENNFITLERASLKTFVSNQKIISDKEVIFKKGNSDKGVLMSYIYNKSSLTGKKNGSILFDDLLFEDKEFKNQLMELIFIPSFIDEQDKAIIESYLSIKYGISLNEGKNYYNSKGLKIWDCKENKDYNHDITGIGRDVRLKLNQKQSKNSTANGLNIGLKKLMSTNVENDYELNDGDFLIWGDNGKSVLLEKNSERTKNGIKRVWKIKPIADITRNFTTQIKFDKKLIKFVNNNNSNDNNFIWIAIYSINSGMFNYETARYIKATIDNENEIIFDNVIFKSGVDYLFTIVEAKENEIIPNLNLLTEFQNSTNNHYFSSGQIMIYPNPTDTNEKFSLQFRLEEPSNVLVQIAEVSGKIITTKKLGTIKNHLYNEILTSAGAYIIMVTINGKLETRKLIVK